MTEEIKIVTPDGRRGLWLITDSEEDPRYVKLRAGREGDDWELELQHGQPVIAKNLYDLVNVVTTLRFAFESAEDDHAMWAKERDEAIARADAAEKKLEAILAADERYKLWLDSDVDDPTYDDAPEVYEAALKAAREKP